MRPRGMLGTKPGLATTRQTPYLLYSLRSQYLLFLKSMSHSFCLVLLSDGADGAQGTKWCQVSNLGLLHSKHELRLLGYILGPHFCCVGFTPKNLIIFDAIINGIVFFILFLCHCLEADFGMLLL